MNIDDVIKDMEAFDNEGPEYLTPCMYAKIRPVQSPQIYQWIRSGQLNWKYCECGRKVVKVEEADDFMRSKGKLPPKETAEDAHSPADADLVD
jgi:hypothetical protein